MLPVSLLLFCGGMALNARVDLAQDRVLRPDRPLSTGQVAPRTASVLAALGLLGGPLVAFALTGSRPLTAGALLLGTLILGYHSPARRHPLLGPLLLGSIRAGDLLLPMLWLHGTSVLSLGLWAPWAYLAYVTGASLVAHQEDRAGGRAWVFTGQILAGLAALSALAPLWITCPLESRWLAGGIGFAILGWEFLPLVRRVTRSRAEVEALAGALLGRMPLLLVLVCLGVGQFAAAAGCLGCFLVVRVLVRFLPPT